MVQPYSTASGDLTKVVHRRRINKQKCIVLPQANSPSIATMNVPDEVYVDHWACKDQTLAPENAETAKELVINSRSVVLAKLVIDNLDYARMQNLRTMRLSMNFYGLKMSNTNGENPLEQWVQSIFKTLKDRNVSHLVTIVLVDEQTGQTLATVTSKRIEFRNEADIIAPPPFDPVETYGYPVEPSGY